MSSKPIEDDDVFLWLAPLYIRCLYSFTKRFLKLPLSLSQSGYWSLPYFNLCFSCTSGHDGIFQSYKTYKYSLPSSKQII